MRESEKTIWIAGMVMPVAVGLLVWGWLQFRPSAWPAVVAVVVGGWLLPLVGAGILAAIPGLRGVGRSGRAQSPLGPVEKDIRHTIVDGTLRTYIRRWLRPDALVQQANLHDVQHIHWYISPFSTVGTVRVTLWDRSTEFELTFGDVVPRDMEARQLAEFRAPDLGANPTAHAAFVGFFAPRIDAGTVTSAIDIHTFQPIQPAATPAPGFISIGGKTKYDPHLAKTARQVRDEQEPHTR